MTDIIPFNYNNQPIRVILQNNEPWWVANDVCQFLDITNIGNALTKLDKDEKNTIRLTDGNRGNPYKSIVNEPGLYQLILTSRKPEAKAFKRWITHEVLPTIRKTGSYSASQVPQIPQQPLQGGNNLLADPEKLALYIHHLQGIQSVLNADIDAYKPISRDVHARDKVLDVFKRLQMPITVAQMRSRWLKNINEKQLTHTFEELANEGILVKTYTNHARRGIYTLK